MAKQGREDRQFEPIVPRILHGADYNPDQWLKYPEVLDADLHLMKEASFNVVSVGIFAWTALEPEEGRYTFDWLDRTMDRLWQAGVSVILATPTAARPAWMSAGYPEVLRVSASRVRNLHGGRHNHCYTSPVYREKAAIINTRLAERYKDHPSLLLWHVSNEYGGECHCGLCQEAFRLWLRRRYAEDLDALNHAWWNAFWSHTYTAWEQIESPAPHGEQAVHGLSLEWKRFVTYQTRDFMRAEVAPLRRVTPDVPLTTNFMGTYPGLDYFKLSEEVDVVSWDSYPSWHGIGTPPPGAQDRWDVEGKDYRLAADIAFLHDLNRSLKGGKPFMLMESTPSVTNWSSAAKLKRPGVHVLTSLQALAHGADTVQYFQWRKSRGSSEKFHGAVVGHDGTHNTRVFREVSRLGKVLGRLADLAGARVNVEVAVLFDWENRWAIEDAQGPRNDGRRAYEQTVMAHHYPFWARGIATDVIDSQCDFSPYRVIVAPMFYMIKPAVAERLADFVAGGGTFVTTYWSGIVDEHDLCFMGGFPGPLRSLLGIWSEELDSLYPSERVPLEFVAGNPLGMKGRYEAREYCDLIHAESAEVLARYAGEFYTGMPAVTLNRSGNGEAYYLAARSDDQMLEDFYSRLANRVGLRAAIAGSIPVGVSAQVRTKGAREFLFLLNFTPEEKHISLGDGGYTNLVSEQHVENELSLEPYGSAVLVNGQN